MRGEKWLVVYVRGLCVSSDSVLESLFIFGVDDNKIVRFGNQGCTPSPD